MDAERWQRLSPLLDAMFELDAATRARSLQLLREEDPQLGADLAELMALEDERDDFLSQPLVAPLPGARPGTLVGPYRLERLLGEGGMGQVWLAARADGLYQRRVALKLLRPGLADPNLRLRFTRERQILARLAHPHIARLLDAGISGDGQPYLALEYVDGEPITDWCRGRALSLESRLRLFLQVCDAVSHAHANLIVHRDLKPSNILVTPLDEVRLLDFGIAKLLDTEELSPDHTGTGLRAFTLHYAAPEQIRGEPVTTMTDVYSLGVVLYELLTGMKPYRLKRQSDAEWEEAILGIDPLRPSLMVQRGGDAEGDPQPQRRLARELSGDLDNIVLKALAKQPEQRYPSVEAMALDLARYRDGKPVLARPQSIGYRVRKYLHRHRWALSTAGLVALVLSSALLIVAWQARQAVQEASRAQALQDFVVGLFEHAGNGSGSGDGPLDVRQLLDAGVERGNRELGRQPAARAELFGVIARLRLGLGDYAPALQLLERQALIVDALGTDAPPSLRLESATDRGRAHLLLGGERACIGVMEPQQPLAQREQKQLPVQVSEFWSQLGRCQRAAGAADAARPLFQRSLALRRDQLHDDAGMVENLADLASLQADAGRIAEARTGYRAALRQLRERVGARHPLSIDLLRSLCALQREAGDTIGAQRDCGSALVLARELHGDNHPATIDARRQLAAIQVDMGRYAEAEAALRESRAWLLARLGPDHDSVARDDNSLGIIAWERGDAAAALAALDRSIAIRRRNGDPLDLAGVLFNKAMVLHDLHRDAQARPLLEEARRLRSARLGASHPLVGDSDRLLGEVDAALGDTPRALAELRAAVRSTRTGYGAAHPHARRAELSLAAFQAARGDRAAMARLDTLAALPQSEIELRKVAWLAGATAAAGRCHGPQRDHALALLQALQADVRNAQPEGGAIARAVAAARASCH
jgi:serine/threonine-protein kinase